MNTQERISELKKQFRSMMNGVASSSMREKGIKYRVNFGVETPRLAVLAASVGKDHELAQALWKENVRECRIMAPMLQPYDSFSAEIADIWLDSIRNQEEAQYVSMYLLQYLHYANEKVFEWIADDRVFHQLCGFHTAARLLQTGKRLYGREANEFLDQCASALRSENAAVVRAAYNALQKYAQQNEYQANSVEEIFDEYNKDREEKGKQQNNV